MTEGRPANGRLGAAIVGVGWWGRTILDALHRSETIEVTCLVDPDPAVRTLAQQRGKRYLRTLEEALALPGVDAVVLCTPHSMHCSQAIAAARSGRHVFCEKPLAMSRRDVLDVIAAVTAGNVCLAVGHEKRFEPPVVEAMRMVKAGEIGTPLQIEANFSQDKFITLGPDNWRVSESEAPAGPMTATGIHLLDLAVGVFGAADSAVVRVRQLGSTLTNGDTLAALVSFKSGGNALISAILATPFDCRFAIYGSEGWIEVRDKAHPEAPEGWTLTVRLRGKEARSTHYSPVSPVLLNLEAFADAAAGRRAYPVSHEEMAANVSALDAIFRSAKTGAIETVEGGTEHARG